MRFFLFTFFIGLAFTKPTPDVSEGYAYPTPASSYGVPLNSRLTGDNIAQVLPNSFSSSLPFAPLQTYQLPSAQVVSFAPVVSTTPSTVLSYESPSFPSFVSSTPAPSFASVVSSTPAPVVSTFNVAGSANSAPAFSSSFSVGSPFDSRFQSSGFQSGSSGLQSGSSGFQLGSSGLESGSSGFQSGFVSNSENSQFSSQSSSAQVSKNLYFFAAPEEPEEPIRPRINVVQAPAQKNYKIIFIKTPEFRQQSVVNVPVVSQNEEKTVVYVLVKRPEDGPQVNVQASSASKPAKPEVYFIKYRTKEEAEEAINNAREGNFAGISANSVENSGFVDSLNGASGNAVESVSLSSPLRSGGGSVSSSSSFEGDSVESVSIGGGSAPSAPLVSLNVVSSSTTPSSFVAVSENSTPTVEVPTVTTLGAVDSGFVQNVVVSSEERVNVPASSGGSVSFVASSTPFPLYGPPPAKRALKDF